MVERSMPVILSRVWFYRIVFSSFLQVSPPPSFLVTPGLQASRGPFPGLSLVAVGMNSEGFVTRKAAGYAAVLFPTLKCTHGSYHCVALSSSLWHSTVGHSKAHIGAILGLS